MAQSVSMIIRYVDSTGVYSGLCMTDLHAKDLDISVTTLTRHCIAELLVYRLSPYTTFWRQKTVSKLCGILRQQAGRAFMSLLCTVVMSLFRCCSLIRQRALCNHAAHPFSSPKAAVEVVEATYTSVENSFVQFKPVAGQ